MVQSSASGRQLHQLPVSLTGKSAPIFAHRVIHAFDCWYILEKVSPLFGWHECQCFHEKVWANCLSVAAWEWRHRNNDDLYVYYGFRKVTRKVFQFSVLNFGWFGWSDLILSQTERVSDQVWFRLIRLNQSRCVSFWQKIIKMQQRAAVVN